MGWRIRWQQVALHFIVLSQWKSYVHAWGNGIFPPYIFVRHLESSVQYHGLILWWHIISCQKLLYIITIHCELTIFSVIRMRIRSSVFDKSTVLLPDIYIYIKPTATWVWMITPIRLYTFLIKHTIELL